MENLNHLGLNLLPILLTLVEQLDRAVQGLGLPLTRVDAVGRLCAADVAPGNRSKVNKSPLPAILGR